MELNQYTSRSWLVWIVLVGLLLVLASDLSLSADSPNKFDWISYNRSEVGFSHACSYYALTNAGDGVLPSGKINSLRINEWVLVHGNVSNERWEWERNVSYVVQVPDYGMVWANSSCNTSWYFNGSTFLCERLFFNESRDCVNLYSLNSTNDTCEFNYTGIISHHPETRYKLVWMEFNPSDFNPSDIILQSGESQNVRVCADISREITDRGWTIEVDHIPEFGVFTYPEWTWWNTSYSYRYHIDNNASLSVPYAYVVNGTHGVEGLYIYALIENQSYVYSTASGPSGLKAIGNETHGVPYFFSSNCSGSDIGEVFNNSRIVLCLDEDTGTVAHDCSGNDNAGKCSGFPDSGCGWCEGIIGNGSSFDATDSTIKINDSVSNSITSDVSVLFRAKIPDAHAHLVAKSSSDGWAGEYNIYYISGTGFYFNRGNGVDSETTFSCSYTASNVWRDYAFTTDGTTWTMYENGTVICSASKSSSAASDTSLDLYIGSRNGNDRWFGGKMDDIVVFNRTVLIQEIKEYRQNGLGNRTSFGAEETAPIISFNVSLNSPVNKTVTSDNTTSHNFTPIGSESTYDCTLYYNNTNRGSNASVSNNTATVITSSEVSDGGYTWYVNCTASSVTNQSNVYNITIDATSPTSDNPSDASHYIDSSATISWTLTDNIAPGYYYIEKNGSIQNASTAWVSGTTYNIWVNTSVIGSLNYTIHFNDSINNLGSDEVIISIDPIIGISLTSPTNCTNTSDNSTSHVFTVSGSGTFYDCVLYLNNVNKSSNSSVFNSTSTTLTSIEVVDGNYLWYVNCSTNSTTNKSVTYNITIDATPPSSTSPVDATHYVGSSQTIAWTLTDNTAPGYYYIEKNGSIQNSSTAWTNNTPISVWVNTTVVGSLNYTIHFNDSVNNLGAPDEVIILIEPVNIAPAQPMIVNISGEANNSIISDSTPDIYFNVTDNNATLSCEITVNQTFRYGVNASTQNNTVTLLSVNSTLLDGTYNFSINCTDGEYENISNTWTMTIDATAPVCTFISQTPSDLNSSSTGSLEILYNCTDASGMNNSKIGIAHTCNHTTDNDLNFSWRFPSNTKADGLYDEQRAEHMNESEWYDSLFSNIYEWAFHDYDCGHITSSSSGSGTLYNFTKKALPGAFHNVFPLDKDELESSGIRTLAFYKDNPAIVEIHYRDTVVNSTVLLYFYINGSGSNKDSLAYYCNESKKTDGVEFGSSSNCAYFGAIDENDAFYYTKSNVSYHELGFYIDENGTFCDVGVSEVGYFVFTTTASSPNAWQLGYSDNATLVGNVSFNNSQMLYTSSDDGITFTSHNGTGVVWLSLVHDNIDEFTHRFYACDNLSNCVWSSITTDAIGVVQKAPGTPTIVHIDGDEDLNGTYSGVFTIGCKLGRDLNGDPVTGNLSLCNTNGIFNYTINGSFTGCGVTVNITFNSSNVADASYCLNITNCDNGSLCSSHRSVNFTIDDVPDTPVHSTPTDNYYTNDNTTAFDWDDNDDSYLDKYNFRLWNNSALTEINVNKTNLSASTYTLAAGEQLPDGTYYWEVGCNTTNGVNSSWSSNWSFTVDTVSPSSTSPADASHYMGSSNTISWTLTDDVVVGYYYIERNGSVQNSSTAWVNNTPINVWVNTSITGSFNYTIHFNDSAGNDGTPDEVFISINPIIGISLSSPANASTTSDNSTDYVFTVSGSGTLYNCSVYLNNINKSNNASVINGSLTTLTSIEVADGNYSWYINCSTNSSTNQSLTYNITIDASVSLFPSVNLTFPTNASRLTGNNVTIRVTLVDSNPDTCLLEWNGVNESFALNTSTLFWSYKSTVDGLNYSFIVFCNNTAGNWNNSGTLHVLENNVSNISSVSVSASNSNVDANCSYVASNDSEGDTVTAYYLWYINGVHSRSFTNISLLDDSLFIQSDNLTCVVKLFDGYENSTPLNSSAIVGTATTGLGGTGGVRDIPTEPTNVSITSAFSFNLASSEVPFISGVLDQPSSRYNVIIRNSSDSVIHIGTFSSDVNRNFLYILPLIFPDIYTASVTNLNDQLLSTIEITVISDTGQVFWQVVPNIIDLELASRVCKSTQVFIVGDRPWNFSYVKETPLSADVSIERSNNILEICIDSEQLDSGESVYEFISLTSSYGSKVVALEITHKPCPTINGFGGGEISLFGAGVCMLHALGYALILFFISLLVTTYRTKEYNKLKFNIQRAFILFVAVVVVIVLINSDVINIDWVVLFEFLGNKLSL